MTGLFGANAVHALPLSDVPSMKARNSQQLNAMIETSLLPDGSRRRGWCLSPCIQSRTSTAIPTEVRLDELDQETAAQVRDVLNAGLIIGAVRRHDAPGRYLDALGAARDS